MENNLGVHLKLTLHGKSTTAKIKLKCFKVYNLNIFSLKYMSVMPQETFKEVYADSTI